MEKLYFHMVCYKWSANNQSGEGYQILSGDSKYLASKDIDYAKEFCAESIEKAMSHSKNAVKIIFTNIVLINHCTKEEFYAS